ncbi:MAG: hypothetical protein JSW20_05350, partial [Nitrospiraceae bacterium]
MVKGLTARAKEMKERLKTVQSSNEMISLRDRLFIYILLILTMIGGTGIVLFPDEAHANWTKNDTCIQCHTALHSTATLDTAVDGVQTTSASIDNDGTDSFELDWMFEGGTWTTNKESVGVMMAVPNGWTVESGTANSPSLTNWSSTWDNVDGGKSWVLMPDTKGDCPVNHDCYSVQFTSPWDHDTASENMACNIGGTTCEAGSAGTDQDGVANRMGTDAVIKTSAGETPGAFTILLYAVGFDDNTKAYKDQTINVTVNAAPPNTDPDDPTNLAQYKSNGSTVISTGGYTEESTVKIEADISDPDGGDTVKLQVDIDGNGSS